MVVLLDQNFMARVPENVIRHSKELKLRKKIAEQQEKNRTSRECDRRTSRPVSTSTKAKTAPLGATKCHKSNDQ